MPRSIRVVLALAALQTLHGCSGQEPTNPSTVAEPRIVRLEEMTYTDIEALDRERAIVFLTFGNLEEHGPHVPVGSDYFQAVALRDGVIERLGRIHPDRVFVLMPVIPLGEGGFNDVSREFDFPGTFWVRFGTLRDVAVDIGSSIARHGFRDIFVVHYHGAVFHNQALTQASAYVSERYGVRMVNLTSLMFAGGIFSTDVLSRHLPEGWEETLGLDLHAGPAETSINLYLRGDLVKPVYEDLPPFVVRDGEALGRVHERDGFLGYANDPARASVELGRDLVDDAADRAASIAAMSLAGEDLSRLPMFPETLPRSEGLDRTLELLEERHAAETADFERWLETRGNGD